MKLPLNGLLYGWRDLNFFIKQDIDYLKTLNKKTFIFRDIRSGNEENGFRIVQDGTLRTAKRFNHKLRKEYVLQIRVFDNGAQPLYSDTYGKL